MGSRAGLSVDPDNIACGPQNHFSTGGRVVCVRKILILADFFLHIYKVQ